MLIDGSPKSKLLVWVAAIAVVHGWSLRALLSAPDRRLHRTASVRHLAHNHNASSTLISNYATVAYDTIITPLDPVSLDADAYDDDVDGGDHVVQKGNRPHEQRTKGPRPARRLNHGYKHLFRHDIPEDIQTMDPMTYLQEYVGYTHGQVLAMNQTFPPLLTLSVPRQLHPKVRFLRETLQQTTASLSLLPPQYFGARLERILAPRHAFLVYADITPRGSGLVKDPAKWELFLTACRQPKNFAALCQRWQKQSRSASASKSGRSERSVSAKSIEAFDVLFGRGLMAAARDDLVQPNNDWPLQHVNITAAEMMDLQIQHGANPRQLDHRGVSLLHWSAGTGNIDAIAVLLKYAQSAGLRSDEQQHRASETSSDESDRQSNMQPSLCVFDRTERDGATPLHWAAAGAKTREFGCGGHVHVCRYLLDQVPSNRTKEYVNLLTKDGNSALMWAAWSGTLETVKLLVRNRAETQHANRNGCTVAHWAASGGNLDVCQYLHDIVGVDFTVPNYGGNTPLTHAVAFGRVEVIEWLREGVLKQDAEYNINALDLAKDIVSWKEGDERREQVFQLLLDWHSFDGDESANSDDDFPDESDDSLQ